MRKVTEQQELCQALAHRDALAAHAEANPVFGAFHSEAVKLRDATPEGVSLRRLTKEQNEKEEVTRPITLARVPKDCYEYVDTPARTSMQVCTHATDSANAATLICQQ